MTQELRARMVTALQVAALALLAAAKKLSAKVDA